ncbi:O-antigen ligase family protein [Enterovibrio sp. ZSDZ35]|uniref:O-antigen ligase family protein n=1 Tax=Enterovibrio qingdaonensis TaxID=2899818 RepID=A0ABT5QNB1_9GAMM|nr:O-antigen ligase family protein [Enterovibrio sp. ZSDZ35]MDD1782374.1 O-antigen ligase family protein [Enterovibrio sp. ZSDZ35]
MEFSRMLSYYMGLGVLFFSGFFLFFFDAENPSATYSIISAQFYFVSGVLIFLYRKEAVKYIVHSPYPLLICLLSIASILWSFEPSQAIMRSIALTGTFCFALCLILVFDWDELLKVLILPLIFAAIASIFVSILVPSIGVDDGSNVAEHAGLWHGTFGFKNRLGRVMGLFAVILVAQNVLLRNYRNSMLAIVLFVLLMTGSSTPILAVSFIVLLKLYFAISHRITTHIKIIIAILSIYCLALVPIAIEFVIIDLMGKDLSGSGRVDMWVDILLSIDSPILGYGFGGGFWGEFGYANGLIDPRYILLGHAHNGFVDTLIELGIFGVFFYFMLLLKCLIDSLRNYRTQGEYFLLPLFLSVFFIIYSVTGSAYIKQNNILFILACLAAFLPYKKVK